jgi:penicillin amidase
MTPQNLVYAETDGTIGYYTLGALPKRMPGTGRFPSEGKGGRVNWEGLVPPEENPALENPPSGFIATANNLVARTFPYDINPTVAPRYRIDRIIRMLEAKERIDVPYAQAMQMDDQSELAEILVPKILELVDSGGDGLIRDALNRLKEWDFRMRKDDPAPAIYNTFLVRFMYQTFVDELGPKLAAQYVGERYVSLERFLELLEEGSEFFDDVTTPQMEDPRQIATRAFREALEMLSEVTGEGRVEAWQWGKVHQIRFDHVLGNVKILRSLVNRGPYPVRGDCETNHRAHFTEVEPPFTAVLASGLRLVVEFDPDPRGYMVLITGQNEYFLSKHYDDMIDLWRAGRYIPLEEVSESHRTVMTPR